MFDWLAVSPEADYAEEALIIERLFDAGLWRYHLRKPHFSVWHCAALLEQLPDACRKRVVLHQHYELVPQFGLAGCHIKDRVDADALRDQQCVFADGSLSISRSLHCISNLDTELRCWDYGFISPVFPSLSKRRYVAEWSVDDLRAALESVPSEKLYALGGVSEDTCERCADYGFKGAVLHGALWMSDSPVERFNEIRKILN